MNYTQINEDDRRQMLEAIGVQRIDDLFRDIPAEYRVNGLLEVPAPLSEPELLADLTRLAMANRTVDCSRCFLGCGAYDHFIPTVVDALAAQSGFVTAYTPYQAEASQGTLQTFYEFQTMICELTGMDVANASLYEVGTALVEAAFMARSATRRPDIVLAQAVNPDCERVLRTYMAEEPGEIRIAAENTGRVNPMTLADLVNDKTAAIVVQSPNIFGQIEPLADLARLAQGSGALLIVATDPLSAGVLKRPGDLG
ncbi:MAG: glycine dehydrogenase, partial [Phycisphaerae bacterium]|nr:glycine dehydrogenase [Phycisphaerae bacterium]